MTYPTAQEVFDLAAGGCLRQGKRCVENGRCVYRGPSGMKCAAGFVLTNEEVAINPQADVGYIIRNMPVCRLHGLVALLSRLQTIHDLEPVEDWPQRFRYAAHDYDLDPSIIDTVAAEKAGAQ